MSVQIEDRVGGRSKKYGEGFHQDLRVMEERHQAVLFTSLSGTSPTRGGPGSPARAGAHVQQSSRLKAKPSVRRTYRSRYPEIKQCRVRESQRNYQELFNPFTKWDGNKSRAKVEPQTRCGRSENGQRFKGIGSVYIYYNFMTKR
ncbi:hypothetical protein EVAR_45487_1 [Eumeta japonica]|uniref:Uncharacterized protein n=1 Tax=Eumeta variegata TaxID=151549 RepID=A0A4C1WEF5_EUMVA|nr:hypothetical protein EVAR_45487_1 [Eumeta japonica]